MRKRLICLSAILLVMIQALACRQSPDLTGKYIAGNGSDPAASSITLELLQNGQGTWSTATDNASFRWNADKNRLWLHTQAGGIIQGAIDKDTIRIKLPGVPETHFRRAQAPKS
jgi:hypothetical protein